MNPTIFGVIGPGFLNQVPTLPRGSWDLVTRAISKVSILITHNYFYPN